MKPRLLPGSSAARVTRWELDADGTSYQLDLIESALPGVLAVCLGRAARLEISFKPLAESYVCEKFGLVPGQDSRNVTTLLAYGLGREPFYLS